jgi:hypothetical protein
MICASVAPGPTGEDPVHRFTEDNVVDDLAVVNSPPAFGLPFYYGAFVAKVCWCRAGGSQPGTAGRRARRPPGGPPLGKNRAGQHPAEHPGMGRRAAPGPAPDRNAARSSCRPAMIAVIRVGGDGSVLTRAVDTASRKDAGRRARLAEQAAPAVPTAYRPRPGEPVYHIQAGGHDLDVAERDLLGPLRELVIAVLAGGGNLR